MKEFWNKPVKIGFFIKLFIVLNLLFLVICMRISYIEDLKDQQEQEYYQYLENRINIQAKLIQVQQELIYEYKK